MTAPDDRRRCQVLGVPVDACRDVCAAALGLHARADIVISALRVTMRPPPTNGVWRWWVHHLR